MLYFSVGFLVASVIAVIAYFVIDRKVSKDPSKGRGTLFVNDKTGEVYAEFDKLDEVEVMELVVKRI